MKEKNNKWSSLTGYNAVIYAYGVNGSGKTYTMLNFSNARRLEPDGTLKMPHEAIENYGIIPRA